ncbi:uncharacterized protein LOC141808678 [Halichoeres trimaculatus]|uniref:uncharacterized protein LOC141808678 n=1 Tax=Halichoeres trimaculatus TaxID=147232 RepID=UPI003D9F43F4
MSADQDVVVNSLKGVVNLLENLYRDALKSAIGSFLKGNIKGGDGLSSFLITLVQNLQSFINKTSMLTDQDIADLGIIKPLAADLLHSSGLAPLLPLIFSDSPFNVSTVLHAAIKVLRENQHIFTFNETDSGMPELGRLIMRFLSLKGNLSIHLPNNMGGTLLSYAGYFDSEDVDRLKEAIRPFTNQTSSGLAETILSAMELVESVIDPNGDPTWVILQYIRQLQNFILSVVRLEGVHQSLLPNGKLGAAQNIDLQLAFKEIFDLLSPEKIQSLIQAGPDDALDTIIKKFEKFLPADFLQQFKALQHVLAKCAPGKDCLSEISDIFEFLDQILEMISGAKVGVKITAPNPLPDGEEYQEIASSFFSLLLSPRDAAYVKTFQQALKFISLVTAMPNITISDVQTALKQSNLTLEDLKELTSLFGAANIDELQEKIMDVINSQKCFKLQHNQMAAPQCVMGLINGITGVLTQLPELKNETAILSLIPSIVNNTINDVMKINFSSNPNEAIIHALDATLDNVKMALQHNDLDTPEVMTEIRVLEGLIQLAANQEAPSTIFNTTLTANPIYAQKVYLQVVHWYLEGLKNITKESSIAKLVQPFLRLVTMQVKLQLVQADFNILLSNHIEYLLNNIHHPIDGAGVSKIGQTVVKILHHLLKVIKGNLEFQNNVAGMELFNMTALHVAEQQIKLYLNIIENCFELQQDQMVAPKCVDELTAGVTSVLKQLPNLQNKTEILNLIPQIINETITDILKTNFSSDSNEVVLHTLNKTLANVKMALQRNHLFTPEVITEIRVLEGLIQLAANQEALSPFFNATLATDPIHAQKVYLQVVHWYLERLTNITKESSIAEPFQPFLQLTLMQVKLQLEQADFELLLTNKIEYLMSNIQHPIDGAEVIEIGHATVEIAHHLFRLIKGNLEFENYVAGMELFNTTVLDVVGYQIKLYLDIIQRWMKHPKVPLVLSSMLKWGNNTNVSTPLKDIHHLLQTIVQFLNGEPQAFLSLAGNFTQSLSKALMAAEQPGGLQSDDFLDALEETLQSAMKILTAANVPLSNQT